ncbi:MAG: hypothetical protein VW271_08440, partial [Chloroflexota bacterium]
WVITTEPVGNTLRPHQEYISGETLAEHLEMGAGVSEHSNDSATTESVQVDDVKITVALEKA